MGRVCFADFGRHKVGSLCLRKVTLCEAVTAGQDGSCTWHPGPERDVEGEHHSVAGSPEREMGYSIHWLPC